MSSVFEITLEKQHARKVHFALPQQPGLELSAYITQGLTAYFEHNPQEVPYLPRVENIRHGSVQTSFDVWFPRLAEFSLPDPSLLQLEVPDIAQPEPPQIQARLRALQIKYGQHAQVQRPPNWGDWVAFDLYATQNDQPIPASFQRLELILDPLDQAQTHLQGLIDQTPGQWFKLEHDGVTSHIYLREVRALRVPPADDHLAQVLEYGATLNDLLKGLYQECLHDHRLQWQHELKEHVVRAYAKQIDLDIPERWIDIELVAMAEQTDLAVFRQFAHAPELADSILQAWRTHANMRKVQATQIKHRFVLSQLAKKYDLALSAAEISEALSGFGDPARLAVDLQEQNNYHVLCNNLLILKVSRFLVQQAQLTCNGQPLNA